jgi:hypothetical protein
MFLLREYDKVSNISIRDPPYSIVETATCLLANVLMPFYTQLLFLVPSQTALLLKQCITTCCSAQ